MDQGQPIQRDQRDLRHNYALEIPSSDFNYTSRANRQSPESYASSDSGRISHSSSGYPHHRHHQSIGEGLSQPVSQFWGTGNSHVWTPPSFPSQDDMGWRTPHRSLVSYLAQSPPDPPTAATRRPPAARGRVEYVPTWLADQPSPPFDAPQDNVVSSIEHPAMAHSPTQYPFPSAYERSHVPAWKESQHSGEFRRQDLNNRVLRANYVLVSRAPQTRGSQSSGSANSVSSSGATGGSKGRSWSQEMESCEFCGPHALLSMIQEHWLSCPRRTSETPSRQGVWMSR
jgi:hypothetical protein